MYGVVGFGVTIGSSMQILEASTRIPDTQQRPLRRTILMNFQKAVQAAAIGFTATTAVTIVLFVSCSVD